MTLSAILARPFRRYGMRRVTNAVTFTGTPAAIAVGGSVATGDIGTINGDPIGGGTAIDGAPNTGYVAP